SDVAGRKRYAAPNGRGGSGDKKHGARGEDCIIEVPIGTIIRDHDGGYVLRDLRRDAESVRIVRGGKGGKGNRRFATPTNRTPRFAEDGQEGESRWLDLELKLIADVGLVGLPNAGKSTLLAKMSAARPKIAAYPFTTVRPQLGIVEVGEYRRFVMADIPGLIEGAHKGVGLGDEFLKHIERTRILLHVVDIAPMSGPTPIEAYRIIRNELKLFSAKLFSKREVVVANKMDMADGAENLKAFERELGQPVVSISALQGKGIQRLIGAIMHTLAEEDAHAEQASTDEVAPVPKEI
ncbi:MAG: GTPase ObgE, partial [Planctomycetes bacterium]|nr:GTPase ObgE [Planctomycetota bacterium]